LITLYEFICKQYQEHPRVYGQRFSPYTDLTFTDEEVIPNHSFGATWIVTLKMRSESRDQKEFSGTPI
jgi:hypothetical protein